MDIVNLSKAAKLSKQLDAYSTGTIGSGPNDIYATVHLRLNALETSASNPTISKSIKVGFANGSLLLTDTNEQKQQLLLESANGKYATNGEYISEIMDLGEAFVSLDTFTPAGTTNSQTSYSLYYQQGDQANDNAFLGSWTLYTGSNKPTKRFLKLKFVLSSAIADPIADVVQFDNLTTGNTFQSNDNDLIFNGDLTLKKSFDVTTTTQTLTNGKLFSATFNPSNYYAFGFID